MDLNGLLQDFDTDEGLGATDAGGAQGPSPETAADPTPETGAAGEVVPPAAATETQAPPAVPLEVQAELDALRAQQEQVVAYLSQMQQGSPTDANAQLAAATGLPPLDPFADDFGDSLDARFSMLEEKLLGAVGDMAKPFQQQQQQAEQAQLIQHLGEQVNDMMEANIAQHGDFVPGTTPEQVKANTEARVLVDTLAASIYPQFQARFGQTPAAMELALTQAADQVRSLLKAAGTGAVTQQANQLATLAGVNGQPGVAVAGVQGAPEFQNPKDVVNHFATRAHDLNAA